MKPCANCESDKICYECEEMIVYEALLNYSKKELINWLLDVLSFDARKELYENILSEYSERAA